MRIKIKNYLDKGKDFQWFLAFTCLINVRWTFWQFRTFLEGRYYSWHMPNSQIWKANQGICTSTDFGIRSGPGTTPLWVLEDNCIFPNLKKRKMRPRKIKRLVNFSELIRKWNYNSGLLIPKLCSFYYIILSIPECLLSNSHLQISFPLLIWLNITLIITDHIVKFN